MLRVVGDPHRADEVTRDALLEIWRTSSRFDPEQGSAMGWMISLAHRRAVDCVRAARGCYLHEESRDDSPNAARTPLELAYFDAYTYADVSRLLDVPIDVTATGIRTSLLDLRRQRAGAGRRIAGQMAG